MNETVLSRTGDRPLAFTGDLVASASSKADAGPGSTRWWELALYRTEAKPVAPGMRPSSRWVLQVSFKTNWQGELYLDSVIVADSDEELAASAKAFDFLKGVRGYPRGQEARQHTLVAELTARWQDALSSVLLRLEPERLG